MPRLRTVPSRLAKVGSRFAPSPVNRQATRALPTNSAAWRRIRDSVLLRDHYPCRCCGRVVCGKGEAHVDHIDGDSGNNPADGSNWQTLCVKCHSIKTAREDGGFGNVQRR